MFESCLLCEIMYSLKRRFVLSTAGIPKGNKICGHECNLLIVFINIVHALNHDGKFRNKSDGMFEFLFDSSIRHKPKLYRI